MANGMMSPQEYTQMVAQQALRGPQTPQGMSQWEQMAFQAGGALGGGLGSMPLMKEAQKQQVQQQQELQSLYKTEDATERYNKLSEYFAQKGDMERADSFATKALRQKEHELDIEKMYETRDKGLRDWSMDLARLGVDKDRIASTDRYYRILGKQAEGKDAFASFQKGYGRAHEIMNNPDAPEEDKAAASVWINLQDQKIKDWKVAPSKTEYDSTVNLLGAKEIGGVNIGSWIKKNKEMGKAFAQTVANDAKMMTIRDKKMDMNAAIEAAWIQNATALKETGMWLWKDLEYKKADVQKIETAYSPQKEAGIAAVLSQHPEYTREQVVEALKAQGKL